MDGLPERCMNRLLCFPVNQGQGGDSSHVAKTGELFQGLLGGSREAPQLPGHEIYHVVGIVLGADTANVPLPSRSDWVERQQLLFSQCGEELDREKWIASGLLVHQLR